MQKAIKVENAYTDGLPMYWNDDEGTFLLSRNPEDVKNIPNDLRSVSFMRAWRKAGRNTLPAIATYMGCSTQTARKRAREIGLFVYRSSVWVKKPVELYALIEE